MSESTEPTALMPTPLPTRPPFPTPEAVSEPRATVMQTIMRLPDAILSVDAAAHPLTGDVVVAAIAAPLTTNGTPHAFVRAYDGAKGLWRTTQNVDIGAAEIGDHRFRSVAVTITGSGEIVAVWGTTALPERGVWVSSSHNFGETWTAPTRIMTDSFGVLDVTATLDGQIVVLALQREPLRAVVIQRRADGRWQAADQIPIGPLWYASSGSVVLVGEGALARIVTLTTASREAPGSMLLASRPLAGGIWQRARVQVTTPTREGLLTNVRGSVTGPQVHFVMGLRGGSVVYSISSPDAGGHWDLPRVVVDAASPVTLFPAVATDPAADRTVALWACCEDARYTSAASTHYAAWRALGQPWHTDMTTPVVTGAIAAADLVLAQAANSRSAWMAWVEGGTTVAVRAIDLNTVIPTDQYVHIGDTPP